MAAKKKPTKATATRALAGPRILEKTVDEYIGTYDSASTAFPKYKGWVSSTNGSTLMHEQYIDLSGYTNDQMTIIPTGITLQDPATYSTTGTSPGTSMYVLDIVSQERLLVDAVENDWLNFLNVPNMPTTTEEFEQILYGQFRWLAPSTSFTYTTALTPINRGEFGSASPTTVAKLWLYRFIINTATDFDTNVITIAASRFVIGATAVKEKDLSFLMRQKRSYELGTGR
jgi:hypothetical protein